MIAVAILLSAAGCSGKGSLVSGETKTWEKTIVTGSVETAADEVDVVEQAKNYTRPANGAKVPDHLTLAPAYTLAQDATEEEARAMCVKAMADQLTFCWTPAQDATLLYTQIDNNRDTVFYASKAYAGMPYAGGGTGLLQALEYYDFESGVMVGLPWDNINDVFGNTCATAVNWALSSVCPSICGTQTSSVTPFFGYVTIGEVVLPADLTTFDSTNQTTRQYVDATDEQALYRAYAQMLPADVFISVGSPNEGAHAMMCYEAPEVKTLANGSIDPENSFATVIDQRITNKETVVNGTAYLMRGRIGGRLSFAELRQKHYLPLRPADLANWQGSVKASSVSDREVSSLAELKEAALLSNYRLARVSLNVVSDSGAVVYQRKIIISQDLFREMKDRAYALNALVPRTDTLKKLIREGRTYTVEVRSLLATGEEFTPVSFILDPAEL